MARKTDTHFTHRVFKSPHKPLTYFGVEARDLFNSILSGIAVFIAGLAFGHWVTEQRIAGTEIGEAVDFVVHVERQPGRRIVREVLALRGYDRDAKRFLIEPVFEVTHATA